MLRAKTARPASMTSLPFPVTALLVTMAVGVKAPSMAARPTLAKMAAPVKMVREDLFARVLSVTRATDVK